MDSVSVISISSASSRCSPIKSESLVSVITVSSEQQRIPVSWESGKVSCKEEEYNFGQKPDLFAKVSSWMETCIYDEAFEYPDILDLNYEENTQTTCIRYDFDKTPPTPIMPETCYTESTPLVTYLEETRKSPKKEVNNGDSHRPNGNTVQDSDISCSPLSPDSQKIELCSYLQLMKPEDAKENNFYIEYRRSGRVKTQHNLKKEQLEVSDPKEVKKESSGVANPTNKSKVDKVKKVLSLKRKLDAEDEVSTELFPLPPKEMYSEITDFEDSVKALVEEAKQPCVSNGFKKIEKRRKFKFGPKLHQKSRTRPPGSNRISLRSNRRFRNMSLDKLILRKSQIRKKARKKMLKKFKDKAKEKNMHVDVNKKPDTPKMSDEKSASRCEIVSVHTNSDDETVLELSKESKDKAVDLKKLEPPKKFKDKAKAKNLHVDVSKKPDTPKMPDEKLASPRCEIVSVHTSSDDENVDLKNFVDDMLELDKMSAEHRKSVIESRILASSSITNLINKKASQGADVQRAYKIFSDLSMERKSSEEKENNEEATSSTKEDERVENNDINTDKDDGFEMVDDASLVTEVIVSEHAYASYNASDVDAMDAEDHEEDEEEEESQDPEQEKSVNDSLSPVPLPALEVLPLREEIQTKSLHRSLTVNNKRKQFLNKYGLHNWSAGANYNKKLNHSIAISQKNGPVLRAFYQEYNLIIAQENLVSFWTQTALGNVLGAQNMWIPKGEIPRIALNSTYTQKSTMDMVITTETSVAFVELWTKEHKSDVREVPLADVFATVYFWRVRQNGLDKKALQLEKIQGFADDVQYCILTCYPKIIVSWHSVKGAEKKTKIRSYHLATDLQTVANISEIQPVQHYVRSLHNIEDGDSMIMGCGEDKITLWNVEYGYIVATIDMSSIESPLSTVWVKCDRGFLFVIQECVDHELRLIAINGMNHSWKKLQNFTPPSGFDGLKGVTIDNGILVAYYLQGILCWNAQSGELTVEEVPNECEYIPSGKNVIMLENDNIIVRHSLSRLITDL